MKPKFGTTEYPETQYNMPEGKKMRGAEGAKELEETEAAVAISDISDKDELPKEELSKPTQEKPGKPDRPKRKTKAPQYYGQVDDNEDYEEDEGMRSEEDDQEYRVKKILSHQKGPDNKWEYLVQFTGYPPNEVIWLKEVALNAKSLKEASKAPILKPRKK